MVIEKLAARMVLPPEITLAHGGGNVGVAIDAMIETEGCETSVGFCGCEGADGASDLLVVTKPALTW